VKPKQILLRILLCLQIPLLILLIYGECRNYFDMERNFQTGFFEFFFSLIIVGLLALGLYSSVNLFLPAPGSLFLYSAYAVSLLSVLLIFSVSLLIGGSFIIKLILAAMLALLAATLLLAYSCVDQQITLRGWILIAGIAGFLCLCTLLAMFCSGPSVSNR
jgi:hypothetical protein